MIFVTIRTILSDYICARKNDDQKMLTVERIKRLKTKNAVILAHFYQSSEVQEIADFVGDSLALCSRLQLQKPI